MIQGVLLDLSGVLYVGDQPLPGAIAALKRLQESSLPVCYITNTTRRTKSSIYSMLVDMGFALDEPSIFTASSATLSYLEQHQLRPHLLIHPALASEYAHLDTSNPNAVVLGDAAQEFTYDSLNEAFRVLMRDESIPLIAMGYNRYFMEPEGMSLDLGAFAHCLEFASNRQAVITGKPAPDFFLQAVSYLGCKAEQTLMVGDDVYSDIEGAMNAGLQGCLVKTGKYREGDEFKIDPYPDRLVEGFNELVDDLLSGE